MLEAFKAHIASHFPEMLESPFLIACSGGVDSMVLWHLCASTRLHFEVAHCNFRLRGEASDADAAFVQKLGAEKGIKAHITSFDTEHYCAENKRSVQQGARELRYAWFRDLLQERGLEFIVTAHHQDDQLETFFINLIRGSGLEGLRGMPQRTPEVRRPLLAFTREEIEAYAAQQGIAWREDASNLEDTYLRNRLRSSVIPALKETDARFLQNFAKSLGFLEGSHQMLKQYIASVRQELFVREGAVCRIPLAGLNRLEPLEPYLHALFSPYGFTDWASLRQLLAADTGKELESPTHRLLKDRDSLLLKERAPSDGRIYAIDIQYPDATLPITLEFSVVPDLEPEGHHVLFVDKETLKEGLQLRKWREGDYFYPLGMRGKQKVSKYFKDHKFSRFEKESQWLLCSGDAIVWIVGHRADDRFKVTPGTTEIIRIAWTEAPTGTS